MKGKSLFGVIGCTLLVGAAIIWVIRRVKRDSVNECNEDSQREKYPMDISPEYITEDHVVGLDAVKIQSANSMYDRHKAAAQVIHESVEKINENTDLPSVHENDFDNMFDELDMLSEER